MPYLPILHTDPAGLSLVLIHYEPRRHSAHREMPESVRDVCVAIPWIPLVASLTLFRLRCLLVVAMIRQYAKECSAPARTWIPATACSMLVNSSGVWLRPSLLCTKTIATLLRAAMIWLSC